MLIKLCHPLMYVTYTSTISFDTCTVGNSTGIAKLLSSDFIISLCSFIVILFKVSMLFLL